MQISDEDYRVWHEPNQAIVHFEGSLRLPSGDYAPIWHLLVALFEGNPTTITIDLSRLTFLNSSGINIIYRFAVEIRKRGAPIRLTVRSGSAAWQRKSLPNLIRFLPSAEIVPPA